MRRDFTAIQVNELWLTAITGHRTAEVKLDLCAVKVVFSGRIVGYSIDERMKSRLAVDALEMVTARRGNVGGCVVHSDRRSQFQSRKYVAGIRRHDLIGSMGRVGAAGDSATMESFFALLQNNVLTTKAWRSRDELGITITTWIERTYHSQRRQARLGRLTPIEYETTTNPTAALSV